MNLQNIYLLQTEDNDDEDEFVDYLESVAPGKLVYFSVPRFRGLNMLTSKSAKKMKEFGLHHGEILSLTALNMGRKTMGHYTNLQEEVKKPGDVNTIIKMDENCGKALRLDISEMKVAISLNHSVKYVEHVGPDLFGNISVQMEVGIGHQNVIVTSNNNQQNATNYRNVNHTVFDNDFLTR